MEGMRSIVGEGLRSLSGSAEGSVGVGIDTTETFSGSVRIAGIWTAGAAAGATAGGGVVEGDGVLFDGICVETAVSSATGAATDFGGTW